MFENIDELNSKKIINKLEGKRIKFRKGSTVISNISNIGVYGIWWSVPIGWILADTVGALYYFRKKSHLILEKATNT